MTRFITWSSFYRKFAFVAAAIVGLASAEFELGCQAPTSYIRMMYMLDVAPDMGTFLTSTLQGPSGAISIFDQWVRGEFEVGTSSAVAAFTEKVAVTSDGNDFCFALTMGFADAPISVPVDGLTLTGSSTAAQSSVRDALYYAAQVDWSSPQPQGVPFLYVFTTALPSTNSGLSSFVGTDCEGEEYPSPGDIAAALAVQGIRPVFFVPAANMAAYTAFLPEAIVVPISEDIAEMTQRMFAVYDHIFCDAPLPTPIPSTSTSLPPTTTTPPSSSTSPLPCNGQVELQLLHVQDGSSSYKDNVADVVNLYTQLLPMFNGKFADVEVAVTSFSDKPMAPVGWPNWDYCYAEDLQFTNIIPAILNAQTNVAIRSGRDWKESQYDAIYEGLKSNNLGWNAGAFNGPNAILKIVFLATDAGPHVAGDVALPWNPAVPCDQRDYPSVAQLAQSFDLYNAYPIFYVTEDVVEYWQGKADDIPSRNPPKVVGTDSSPSYVYDQFFDALTDLCNNLPR